MPLSSQDYFYSSYSILIKYINLYLKASYNIYLLWGCLYIFFPPVKQLCASNLLLG